MLHNIVIDKNDVIHKFIILWIHHNLGYRQQVVKNVPQSDSKQQNWQLQYIYIHPKPIHFNE